MLSIFDEVGLHDTMYGPGEGEVVGGFVGFICGTVLGVVSNCYDCITMHELDRIRPLVAVATTLQV